MNPLGKYEIRSKLGEGATSTVHLAFDPFTQREVAIKIIFPEALKDKQKGSQYRRMLINEAALAGKLMHPHIVQIYDAVIDKDQSYIVMEYVPGGTLEQYIRPDNLLPIDRVVEIIFKCTRALDYAFQNGVTHRDIKPANLLLVRTDSASAPGGDIKISDFGAALLTGNDETQVMGVGSPAYMSPQQIRDLPLDHQTDIYSLGVVMYQLLTGQLPFKAANHYGMLHQILNAEPPPPSSYRTDIPSSLDAIVARAMQKDITLRYASWGEFAHDLAQAFRNQQLQARRQEFPDSEKFETLRALPFFQRFSDVEIWEVVRFSRWDEVAANTVIMKEGEPGDFFCFLFEGEARVFKNDRSLGQLGRGDCFGEMAIIGKNNPTRSANVIAQSVAKVITLRGAALQNASDTCRMHFYQAFLEVLAARLNEANIRLSSI